MNTRRGKLINDFLYGDTSDTIVNGAPAEVPTHADEGVMVSRSLRLSLATDERLRKAAAERNMGVTVLMREVLEFWLASLDESATVPIADVLRVIGAMNRPSTA